MRLFPSRLAVVVVLTSPLLLADPQPAEAQGRKGPSPGYVEFAGRMSNGYTIEGEKPSARPRKYAPDGRPDKADVFRAATDLDEIKDPIVVSAIGRLKARLERAREASDNADRTAVAASRGVAETGLAALRGDFESEVERNQVVRQSDGTTKIVTSRETVDDGAFQFGLAGLVGSVAVGQANKRRDDLFDLGMEQARLQAWLDLAEKLDREYATTTNLRNAVVIRPRPATADGQPVGFVAINRGRETLTNVTLILKLVHFMTYPEVSTIQVYFVPRWEASKVLQFPSQVAWNVNTSEMDNYGRPTLTNPRRSSEALAGVGGIVEIEGAVWAEQGRIAARSIKFPAHRARAAEFELNSIGRLMAAAMNPQPRRTLVDRDEPTPKAKPKPDEVYKTAHRGWCGRAATRVVAFIPPGSPLGQLAKLAVDDPSAFYAEFLKHDEAALDSVIAPGKTYKGTWTFSVSGFAEGTNPKVRSAILSRDKKTGPIALRIDSRDRDTGRVVLTLFDPDNPSRSRKASAEIGGFPGIVGSTLPPSAS